MPILDAILGSVVVDFAAVDMVDMPLSFVVIVLVQKQNSQFGFRFVEFYYCWDHYCFLRGVLN